MAKEQAGDDRYSGSSFDDFLEEEGLRDETESVAVKRVLAWRLAEAMAERCSSKQAMAAELGTSRSQVNRLLDPNNVSVSLESLVRAAHVLGKRLVVEMQDAPRAAGEHGRPSKRMQAGSRPSRKLTRPRERATAAAAEASKGRFTAL